VLSQALGAKLLSTILSTRIEVQTRVSLLVRIEMRAFEDSAIYAIPEVPMKLLFMINSVRLENRRSGRKTVSGGLITLCHVAA